MMIGTHPRGLYVLTLTETWGRFSYYGMRALLVYYMMKHLLFTQESASYIYGLYSGLVNFTPLFGGLLADRLLGQRRTVILGAALMTIGQFLMAVESMFFPALALLVLGSGAFKPNVATQVGMLYPKGDHRSDRAFTIFYFGINLGGFFSPLVCGTLGEVYGWHYGFIAAGAGMFAGLLIYLSGQKHLAVDYLSGKAGGLPARDEPPSPADRRRIFALVALMLLTVFFWAAYEQQGNTLALWADSYTDRHILGWEMPATWFQSFNPAMIFILTPFVTGLWAWQGKRGREPASITKMALGCVLVAASFLIMMLAARAYGSHGKAHMWWLAACIFMLTLGELFLVPVGLSLVARLAPARIASMLMGVWLLSSFAGSYLTGYLGSFWERMAKADFFMMLSLLSLGAGLGMFALGRPLKKIVDGPDSADGAAAY